MAGNVSEWTSSLYCPYSSSWYEIHKCQPVRVVRGGSWSYYEAARVRGADRGANAPAERRIIGVGFRCARDL
jgi:formylglycine-generating enzyme required for sulfatase activity